MPFQPKPIAHGTGRGYNQHRYRQSKGLDPGPCDDCREGHRVEQRERFRTRYQTDPEFRAAQVKRVLDREREQRRLARRGRIHDVIGDHLEALVMQWGRGVPMAVVVDAVVTRHPDLSPTSVRRVFYRMVEDGRIRGARLADELRYRLNEDGTGG